MSNNSFQNTDANVFVSTANNYFAGEIGISASSFSLSASLSTPTITQTVNAPAFSLSASLSTPTITQTVNASAFVLTATLSGTPTYKVDAPAFSLSASLSTSTITQTIAAPAFTLAAALTGTPTSVINAIAFQLDLKLSSNSAYQTKIEIFCGTPLANQLSGDLFQVYRCTLTGEQDGVEDLVLPISTFNGSKSQFEQTVTYAAEGTGDIVWSGALSTGDRTGSITVSASGWSGSASSLVDGETASGGISLAETNFGQHLLRKGSSFIQFTFGAPIKIEAVKIYQDSSGSMGGWMWQGRKKERPRFEVNRTPGHTTINYIDGSWESISPTFSLCESSEEIVYLSNDSAYDCYRLVSITSGWASISAYVREIDFKTSDSTMATTGTTSEVTTTYDNHYLSVVVPGDDYEDEIAKRPNGHLKIEKGQKSTLAGETFYNDPFINIPLDQVNIDKGPKSRSITLYGRYEAEAGTPAGTSRDVTAAYYAENNGIPRVRIVFDDSIEIGDTITFEDLDGTETSTTVDTINYNDPAHMELVGVAA